MGVQGETLSEVLGCEDRDHLSRGSMGGLGTQAQQLFSFLVAEFYKLGGLKQYQVTILQFWRSSWKWGPLG